MSSKSPMLVLQKRLELAMSEIQDLRTQIDDLDGRLNGRTEVMDRRIELMIERQDDFESFMNESGSSKVRRASKSGWVRQLEALVEEDMPTPIATMPIWIAEEATGSSDEPASPTAMVSRMPGYLALSDRYDTLPRESASWFTEEFLVWCIAIVTRDETIFVRIVALALVGLCCAGFIDSSSCVGAAFLFALNTFGQGILQHLYTRSTALYRAAQVYDLSDTSPDRVSLECLEEGVEIVPLVLA